MRDGGAGRPVSVPHPPPPPHSAARGPQPSPWVPHGLPGKLRTQQGACPVDLPAQLACSLEMRRRGRGLWASATSPVSSRTKAHVSPAEPSEASPCPNVMTTMPAFPSSQGQHQDADFVLASAEMPGGPHGHQENQGFAHPLAGPCVLRCPQNCGDLCLQASTERAGV